METILAFLSDLILLTAGIVVCILWLIVFMVISVEIYDLITGKGNNDNKEEEQS